MAPFEALHDRGCRKPLCWYESGETAVIEPEIIQQTSKKIMMIQEKMKASQSHQKSYHDKRRKEFEFQEGDHVFFYGYPSNRCWWRLEALKAHAMFCWFILDLAKDVRGSLSDCLAIAAC